MSHKNRLFLIIFGIGLGLVTFLSTPALAGNLAECMKKCAPRFINCSDQTPSCVDIPECQGLEDNEVEAAKGLCDACRGSDADCSNKILPKTNTVPVPVPSSTATTPSGGPMPPAAPTTPEQLCRWQGGVWIQEIDEVNPDTAEITKSHFVCVMLRDVIKRVKILETRMDSHDKQLEDLRKKIEGLGKNPDPAVLKSIETLLTEIENTLKNENAMGVALAPSTSSDEVKPIWFFGFQVDAVSSIHVVRPYDTTQWGIGVRLTWLPKIAPGWNLVGSVALSYAGNDSEGDSLKMWTFDLGAQVHVIDEFYWAYGFVHERRLDDLDTLEFAFYGGFLEPKLCMGDGPGKFCAGLNLALGGTQYATPATLVTDANPLRAYSNIDFSGTIALGGALIP